MPVGEKDSVPFFADQRYQTIGDMGHALDAQLDRSTVRPGSRDLGRYLERVDSVLLVCRLHRALQALEHDAVGTERGDHL